MCEILKLLIIPIAITIGLITYYKKIKNNKYKKIVKILLGITILIIAGLIIYYINLEICLIKANNLDNLNSLGKLLSNNFF